MLQSDPAKKGQRVAVVAGLRTPFSRQSTAFSQLSALDLGQMVVKELIGRSGIDACDIEQLVFGQVIQMPKAPNIAREIVLASQLDVACDAYSVSRACATSFQSIANISQAIALGEISCGIAGGADSSSVLPMTLSKKLASSLLALSKAKTLRARLNALKGLKPKDLAPEPPAIAEYSTGLSMGQTAEQMAKTHQISRSDQDSLTQRSHQRAAQAWQQNILDDEVMTAYPAPYKWAVRGDNNIRENCTVEQLASLPAVFDRQYGSVSAGNSSPLTDGAAAVLLMREDKARALGLPIKGFIRSFAFSATDVWQDMLMGPAHASPIALSRAGLALQDMDLIDMHEAFAAQVLANVKMFASKDFAKAKGLSAPLGEIDMDKFNVLGGSIAYGHPFAATGARMVTQTLNELSRRGGGLALTCACAAGGLGAAMVLEAE